MRCQKFQEYLDGLLVSSPDETAPQEVIEQLKTCARCARDYEGAKQTLASLQPSHKFRASPHLQERIMNQIININATKPKRTVNQYFGIKLWKWTLAAGVGALLLVSGILSLWFRTDRGTTVEMSASRLLSRAWAAEEALFTEEGIVHIVNEIVVKAVSNPVLARGRWMPVVSVEATGKPRFHQLTLTAEPGEQYTVNDEAWYDPSTGQVVRLFTVDGRAIFATS